MGGGYYSITIVGLAGVGYLIAEWLLRLRLMRDDIRDDTVGGHITALFSPFFIAIIAGSILGLTGVERHVPSFIMTAAKWGGHAVAPLVMLAVGASLCGARRSRETGPLILLSVVRLVCCPALMIMSVTILAHLLGPGTFPRQAYNVLLMMSLMPVAAEARERLEPLESTDLDFAETAMLYTTPLAVVMMPIVYLLFSK